MSAAEEETIREMFQRMDGERQERIRSSEVFAYYTVPSAFPRDDNGDNSQGVGMLDSIGSQVVNHFANKLVTTLFSPNRPFFRLDPAPDSDDAKEIKAAQEDESDPQAQAQANEAMNDFRGRASRVEKDAVAHLEKISYRTAAVEMAKLLVITGDGVIRNPGNGRRPSVYTMKDYVCLKDGAGIDKVLIIRDALAFGALPDSVQEQLQNSSDDVEYSPTTEVKIYTKYELQDNGRYQITQASDHVDLFPGEPVEVPPEQMKDTHLSWNLHRGENYGRGLVEDYAGSFHMIDALSRTIGALAGRIAAQKVMVDPQAGVDIDAMNTSDGSTYISGRPDALGTQKLADPQDIVAMDQIMAVHKRQISSAFLFGTGNVRDAERVTAEEIRETAAELEIAHGGVYSRFSGDWQRKAAAEAVAEVDGPLGDDIDTQIITGMDSLSRQGEMQAVRVWIQDLSMLNSVPEDARAVIKKSEFAAYAATQRGVDHSAFVMTEAEIQQLRDAEAERIRQEQAQEQQGRIQEAQMRGGR